MPHRVVGFGADKGNVEWIGFGRPLQFGDLQRVHLDSETFWLGHAFKRETLGAHRLHVLGPDVDKRWIVAFPL